MVGCRLVRHLEYQPLTLIIYTLTVLGCNARQMKDFQLEKHQKTSGGGAPSYPLAVKGSKRKGVEGS